MTLEKANIIIDAALEKKAELNFAQLTVAVLDSGGHLLTFDEDFRYIEGLDCTTLEA